MGSQSSASASVAIGVASAKGLTPVAVFQVCYSVYDESVSKHVSLGVFQEGAQQYSLALAVRFPSLSDCNVE